MRSSVLAHGKVPANPESILGYRETVTANQTKKGVLADDLSVLRGCDELWVFTDFKPNEINIPQLAEGVLVELLYFLMHRSPNAVQFIPVAGLFSGVSKPLPFPFSYDKTVSLLAKRQGEMLLRVIETSTEKTRADRQLAYHIVDPLDFKYSHWLRPEAYKQGFAPVIPSLAVEIRDAWPSKRAVAQVFIAWLKLMELASCAWLYPSLDRSNAFSRVTYLMESHWRCSRSKFNLSQKSWSDYSIPKAVDPAGWSLTRSKWLSES